MEVEGNSEKEKKIQELKEQLIIPGICLMKSNFRLNVQKKREELNKRQKSKLLRKSEEISKHMTDLDKEVSV